MQGNPTYQQTCKIVGAVYIDAFLRIEALEEENKQLKSRLDSLRKDNETLKNGVRDKNSWNHGKGNSILPESFVEGLVSQSTDAHCTLDRQVEHPDSSLLK